MKEDGEITSESRSNRRRGDSRERRDEHDRHSKRSRRRSPVDISSSSSSLRTYNSYSRNRDSRDRSYDRDTRERTKNDAEKTREKEKAKLESEEAKAKAAVEKASREEEQRYTARVEQQLRDLEKNQKSHDAESNAARVLARERRRKLMEQQNIPTHKQSPSSVPQSKVLKTSSSSSSLQLQSESSDESKPPQKSSVANGVAQSFQRDVVEDTDGTDDDDFDMFSESPVLKVKSKPLLHINENPLLTDNWDDSEGYYCFRTGDVLDGRYEVFAHQGRGVFSTVLRVRDLTAGNTELVVKVIRRNEVMYKAGLKEVNLLQIIAETDPDNHRHCVRLKSKFEHRNHLCLVFEPMHMNLREVLRKFGGVGINIDGVRSYAKQLFISLKLLKKCQIVHGDIKLDNILVNSTMNVLKMCDFGSAGMVDECEITPYLVSRFYRAPEISLGLPYGLPIDIWSIGCVLFELYTGEILFKGSDNNDMLRLILETKGKFPNRLLKKAQFWEQHFDITDMSFLHRRLDPITHHTLTTKIRFERPTRDILTLLRRSAGRMTDDESRGLVLLRDLIEKCLVLDPSKRLTPEAAKLHPFLSSHTTHK